MLWSSRSRLAASLALAMGFALIFGASAALAPEADALAAISTLSAVKGDVFVRHPSGDLARANEGDVIVVGDAIRTGSDALAEITYFEGSSVRIEADTELVVENLSTASDGGTVIVMWQAVGRTWHVVTKLITGGSRYEVRTPSSTATVRGTIFAVDVEIEPDGPVAIVTTSEGTVVHSSLDPVHPGATTEVRVTAGQQSKASRGKATEPADPAAASTLSSAPKRPASSTARPTKERAPLPPTRTTSRDVGATTGQRAIPAATVTRDRAKPAPTEKSRSRGEGSG
ncbi:MAG TPA: FecR family protein [Candidatus Limnocylindria bacterium]|nr:FecR family protein [Candidatus Limnocylindria bacterium]